MSHRINPTCPPTRKSVALEGLPAGRSHSKALDWVDAHALQQDEWGWTVAADVAREILGEYGYKLGEMLGSGRYAKAFRLKGEPGYVAKLTGDPTDALAWVRVGKAGGSDGLAETPCVFAAPLEVDPAPEWRTLYAGPRRLFVIVQEHLRPLGRATQHFFVRGDRFTVDTQLLRCLGQDRCEEARALWDRTPGTGDYSEARALQHVIRTAEFVSISSGEIHRMIRTLRFLATLDIYLRDIHAGNVMHDAQGRYKFVDLGVSESPDMAIPLAD